jgi:dihydrodipicolinate synthase/N-acetylneuraminate lyase
VDYPALERLVDYAIAEGASALMPTALTGEGPLLSDDETLVDVLERTSNPTGAIKAGVRLRGIDVGVPRAPGQDLLSSELEELRALLSTGS